VNLESLSLTDEKRQRFHKAMHALGLQPFVHPSQLFHSISAHNQQAENTPLKDVAPDLTECESLGGADEARWKEAISHAQGKL